MQGHPNTVRFRATLIAPFYNVKQSPLGRKPECRRCEQTSQKRANRTP